MKYWNILKRFTFKTIYTYWNISGGIPPETFNMKIWKYIKILKILKYWGAAFQNRFDIKLNKQTKIWKTKYIKIFWAAFPQLHNTFWRAEVSDRQNSKYKMRFTVWNYRFWDVAASFHCIFCILTVFSLWFHFSFNTTLLHILRFILFYPSCSTIFFHSTPLI